MGERASQALEDVTGTRLLDQCHWPSLVYDDGPDPTPSIKGHQVTVRHNQSAYQDFQVLTGLVASL